MVSQRSSSDILIIGGGLHGLSAAIHLSQAGYACTVLEKDYSGRHASGVNAGGVRRLGRHIAEIPLSLAALERWHTMEDWLGEDCGFVACDQIKVAETEVEFSQLAQRVQNLVQAGFNHEVLIDKHQLREQVPALSTHCQGAIWCANDGSANPYRTVCAFRAKALELGVSIYNDCEVKSVTRENGVWKTSSVAGKFEAPVVINAAGAWGRQVASMLGDTVPLESDAYMLMISEPIKPLLTQVLGACGRALSFKQFDNGTLMIGGGHRGSSDIATNKALVDPAGLKISAQTVLALFPQLDGININRFWAGIEGVTPDGIPIIGPAANAECAYHVFGFCGHGFQLSPITGQIITQLVETGIASLPIENFSIERFSR